jgi:hypothetical protein
MYRYEVRLQMSLQVRIKRQGSEVIKYLSPLQILQPTLLLHEVQAYE